MDQSDISQASRTPHRSTSTPEPRASSGWARLQRWLARFLNRHLLWHKTPFALLGYLNLYLQREVLRKFNLADTGELPSLSRAPAGPPPANCREGRTADGSYNDLQQPAMGRAGERFGRNIPLDRVRCEPPADLYRPNPVWIADQLLDREAFIAAESLNMLAAAWIQFMVHDWFAHGVDQKASPMEVPGESGARPRHAMRMHPTPGDPTRAPGARVDLPTYLNRETHWWDGSQIYGSNPEILKGLRSGTHGKLRVTRDNLLETDQNGDEMSGVTDNWWLGLSLMHTLLTLEHNHICDELRKAEPARAEDDEWLFATARLINVALIAKIHILEWTPTAGGHPALKLGVKLNWWGVLGEWFVKRFGRVGCKLLTGIVGSHADHEGTPYAMTEEFVAVYRMHPLLRDDFEFRSLDGSLVEQCSFEQVRGQRARQLVHKFGLPSLIRSLAVLYPGAITLHNFPKALRHLEKQGERLDLAAIDIMRDRERAIPRYNEFRELMHLPRVRSFDEINPKYAPELERVYGDVDRVDLMVGLLAEKPPEGFAFSDTTFRVFILMASRRLQSDRFFTTHYGPALYTNFGIKWIDDNDLKQVLLRHCPSLAPALKSVREVFRPWQ